ncbi:Ig-like domain-containing protein [uncultured Phenylobacterium sp.]|uniref:Ig-like domain-containing protein n=1 Tax=uncultured Phenylobacterium sp. TaxID=349273 RepID=UPI0025EF06D8|nr:Ig-like domain-containing protein [uncultured Phenylobacterium sp.]
MGVPTVTITVADASIGVGETSLITFVFSEAVYAPNFQYAGGQTYPSGSVGGYATSDNITWTTTFTPTAGTMDATNMVTLDMSVIYDLNTEYSGVGVASSNNYAVDTERPTASVVVDYDTLRAGDAAPVTFTFSEAVTNFANADLTIASGTLSAVTDSGDGITWTATLTPTASVTVASNLISLNLTTITDLAGNTGLGSQDSNSYAVSTVRPTATIVLTDDALKVGETSLVTFTFSEAVSGLDAGDMVIANGAIGTITTADGGVVWTGTFTPTAAITEATNLIVLNNAAIENAAGNVGAGVAYSNNYAIDTAAPTASIVVTESGLLAAETSLVTFTFSEAVTGFVLADVATENGSLSNLTTGDNVTWTATLTPTAGVTDTSNVVTLDRTLIADAAGNAGIGVTSSNNYEIDTPTPAQQPPPPPPAPIEMPGTASADIIVGNALSNTIVAGDADDVVSGGSGDDTVSGDAGDDRVQGNIGADDVAGGAGADWVLGGQDDDHVQGNTGADYVAGDKGDDTVLGGQDQDVVYGGEDDDYASGDRGDDTVRGGQGDDQVLGGDGNDFVSGDRGSDTVTGGLGADLFHSFGAAGVDLVTDFNFAEGDRVMLDLGTIYVAAQVGLDTVITMEGGAEMTLANVALASLAPDWIFAA